MVTLEEYYCILQIPSVLVRNHVLLDHLPSQTQLDVS